MMSADSTEMMAVLRARLLDHPLWEFALALYARPGVEAACLRLQDEAGVDVCELLWRCWLLRHGARPSPALEAALPAVLAWQQEVTVPLRALRRRLKAEAATAGGVAELRETLKRAELQAEGETLSRLERLATSEGFPLCTIGGSDAEKVLASRLTSQKKPDLSTLATLIAQLDPPPGPR